MELALSQETIQGPIPTWMDDKLTPDPFYEYLKGLKHIRVILVPEELREFLA